jgi:hypothetical protein
MPVEYFLRYKGKCYDIGTKLKFKVPTSRSVKEGSIEWISHNKIYIRLTDGSSWELSKMWSLDNTIIEIVDPIYYEEPPSVYTHGKVYPSEEELFIGLVWYIVIMLLGFIFRDRWTIWIVATAIFLLWKNGFFNGGKKQ